MNLLPPDLPLARARGQILEDLMQGDPLAWAILAGVVVTGLVAHFWRKRNKQ